MLLPIFYPRVLKDTIAQFDRDRDLNVSVITLLDRYIIVSPVVMLMLSVYIWGKYDFLTMLCILIVVGVITYKIAVLWLTFYFILPYSRGTPLEGDILQAGL